MSVLISIFFFSFLNVSPIGKGLLKRSSTLNYIEMSFTFTAFSSKDAVTRDKVLRMTPEEILYLSIFKYKKKKVGGTITKVNIRPTLTSGANPACKYNTIENET